MEIKQLRAEASAGQRVHEPVILVCTAESKFLEGRAQLGPGGTQWRLLRADALAGQSLQAAWHGWAEWEVGIAWLSSRNYALGKGV